MNKPYTILDKEQSGGLIEMMKLSSEMDANNQPLLKLCQVTGRKVSSRDLLSGKIHFFPIKEPVERISCITSGSYLERSLAAVAYTERMNAENDEIVLGIQIF